MIAEGESESDKNLPSNLISHHLQSYAPARMADHTIPSPTRRRYGLTSTNHPEHSVPTEPAPITSLADLSPQIPLSQSTTSSPQSSSENLGFKEQSSTDSETPPSTPPAHAVDTLPELVQHTSSQTTPKRRRRASTLAANSEDIKRILGDGGTSVLEKCCGAGCCKLEQLSLSKDAPIGVNPPDNVAFHFLNLQLSGLQMDAALTRIVDLPENNISFATLRKQSITEKFPNETSHGHEREIVNVYPPEYMKPHPPYTIFNAPLYGARELTKKGAEKRTFHFDIDVTDYPEEGGVDFKVGGAIGICPPNDPAVVEYIMDRLGVPLFQRDKPVRLFTKGGRWPTIWGDESSRELVTTRREVLTWTLDISSTPPTKPVLRLLAEHTSDSTEKKILLFLCSAQGQAAFCDLRTGPHTTVQQLLAAFPSSLPPLEALCGVLNQLMPRFYSLSNDPHVSSAREGLEGRRLVEVAVTVHETPGYTGTRTGVGSGFLERVARGFIAAEEIAQARAAESGSHLLPGAGGRGAGLRIPMFRGLMANPLSKEFASDGPMVLIGAGVGMAPFRGFILNRVKNANCANKIWLIQGIRDSMLDELYQGELGEHEHEIKKVVESRKQHAPPPTPAEPTEEKDAAAMSAKKQKKVSKYVQDEVRAQAKVVWFVINSLDGRIFVCGSSQGMGEGVERALVDVAMMRGGLDGETATAFWNKKREDGQLVVETW